MCFSPLVMFVTFLIEFFLLFYVLWRYKRTPISLLVVATLACLGIFQLAEYMICGGLGFSGNEWVRLGYVTITLLPPLGIHLITKIAQRPAKGFVAAAYLSAAVFVGYFVFAPGVQLEECAPNYAIFHIGGLDTYIYAMYYYGWLLAAIGLASQWAKNYPKKAAALRWTAIGYASFIIPTTIANIISPATIAGIPSIMCGFAVLLAIILVGRVLPLTHPQVHKKKRK